MKVIGLRFMTVCLGLSFLAMVFVCLGYKGWLSVPYFASVFHLLPNFTRFQLLALKYRVPFVTPLSRLVQKVDIIIVVS